MGRLAPLGDERGLTLVELLVAISAGVVVLFGVVTALIVTLRETDRVTTRVHADQRARLAMSKVIDELHSSCVASGVAPIQPGSTATLLRFWHQTGSETSLTPVESRIALTGTTLSQADYAATAGSAPVWEFAAAPDSSTQIMTGVSPLTPGTPVFSYYAYEEGEIAASPLATPLTAQDAARTVQVNVAFRVAPLSNPVADPNAAAGIRDSAQLRLSPASFEPTAEDLPCK